MPFAAGELEEDATDELDEFIAHTPPGVNKKAMDPALRRQGVPGARAGVPRLGGRG